MVKSVQKNEKNPFEKKKEKYEIFYKKQKNKVTLEAFFLVRTYVRNIELFVVCVCVEITQTSHKKKRGKDLPLKLDAQEREREKS